MARLTIHGHEDPKKSWLEVDGQRIDGVRSVVVSDAVRDTVVTFYAVLGDEGVDVLWEGWEEK